MISVDEAERMMMEHVRRTTARAWRVDHALDHWCAQDVITPYDHPLFDMSAVDGFAVNGDGPLWNVVDAIPAGKVMNRALAPGQCARIFTGAAVPDGTRSIIMQEHGTHEDGIFRFDRTLPAAGANIRRKGESFQTGAGIFKGGQRIGLPAIGLLASAGITEVEVHERPLVAVVRTGGEFAEEGTPGPGRIFSSNDRLLHAGLMQEGIYDELLWTSLDDRDDLMVAIEEAHDEADVIITTGGVSVSDHDLVAEVLVEMGAVIHFHGVAQKPGKPMLFATLDGTPVFGLPGNPRAVMVLFWEYVLPYLRAMQGAADPWLKTDQLPVAHELAVKGDRAEFRAAKVKGGKVTLLADEGSHMLGSLVTADALAYLPANKRSWTEGEHVEVHFIPS